MLKSQIAVPELKMIRYAPQTEGVEILEACHEYSSLWGISALTPPWHALYKCSDSL